LAVLLVIAASPGCAHRSPVGGTAAAPDGGKGTERVVTPRFVLVSVENHNWSDVVVSVVRDGASNRIGTVTAASNAVLRLPGHFIEGSTPLQLIAHPIGDRASYRSQPFVVQAGQQITWTLENGLARSSLAVF
jgi:hypothetical protein